MRLDRLWQHGAGRDDRDRRPWAGRRPPVAARRDVRRQRGRERPLRLWDRPRREPQIDGAAVVRLQVFEAPAEDLAQLVGVRRLERRQPRLPHPDQWLVDRLMRASLRRERDAGRRADDDEARVLVAGVVQRVEAAADERVVDRPDRQQPFAEERRAQPERRQQYEEVVLGDPQLDVLAPGRDLPVEGGQDPFVLEEVAPVAAAEDVPAVEPGSEAGRHGDVGRRGDDAVSQLRMGACEVRQEPPERLLRRQPSVRQRRGRLEPIRHGDPRRAPPPGCRLGLRERHAAKECLDLRRGDVQPDEAIPFLAVADPHPLAERHHLIGGDQAGVVVLVAGERQTVALDRVGNEAGWPIVGDGTECVTHRLEVVPPQVGHEPSQRVVVMLVEQRADAVRVAQSAPQFLAPRRPSLVSEGPSRTRCRRNRSTAGARRHPACGTPRSAVART